MKHCWKRPYRLNKTIQILNAYVSVITCVRSVRLRQIHNSESVYATRRWQRTLRTQVMTFTYRHWEFEWFCSACTFLSLTLWLLLTEQIHMYMHNWMALCFPACGKVTTLNRCGEQHNMNMLQIFSATILPNTVKFGQHLAKLFPK